MQFNVTNLRQDHSFIAILAIQPCRLGNYILHVPSTFAASRKRFATLGQTTKTDLKQLVHTLDILDKILKFELEHFKGMFEDRFEISFALSNQV